MADIALLNTGKLQDMLCHVLLPMNGANRAGGPQIRRRNRIFSDGRKTETTRTPTINKTAN